MSLFFPLTAVPGCFGAPAAGLPDLSVTSLMKRSSMGNHLRTDLIASFYFSFFHLAVPSFQNNFGHLEAEKFINSDEAFET